MIRNDWPAWCLALSLLGGGTVAATVPEMDEYAYGFPLVTGERADYFHLTVPMEVYRSAADRRLRDLGVYDATGRAIPRLVEPPGRRPELTEVRIELPYFPVPGDAAVTADELAVLLRRGDAGTELEITTGDDVQTPAGPPPPASYILDLRRIDNPPEALVLDWEPVDETFVGRVLVEGSDDLERWTRVGQGAVASLDGERETLIEDRIDVGAPRHDFLRLRPSGLPSAWRLGGVTGIIRERRPIDGLEWVELEPAAAEGGSYTYEFVDGPPVDAVQLVLDADQTILRGSVDYYDDRLGRWVRLQEGVFFRWSRDGEADASPAKAVVPVRAERFRVDIDKGRRDVPVRLRLGWRPDKLYFVAEGEPPWVLAAGRAADEDDGFPQEASFHDPEILRTLRERGDGAAATIGPRFVMAGSRQLEARRVIRWSTVGLWLALVVAVALVGWMAWRLYRQMSRES